MFKYELLKTFEFVNNDYSTNPSEHNSDGF